MMQEPEKKGAEMSAAKGLNESPDFFSTVLCRSSVNEDNELNFCCRFCTRGDSHTLPFLWA